VGKDSDLLEIINREALDRCAVLDTDPGAYVDRFNKSDWLGVIVVGLIFSVILAVGWV